MASAAEDIATFAEKLRVKDEIVDSLTVQLAQQSDAAAQSLDYCKSAQMFVETTQQLEQLSVSLTAAVHCKVAMVKTLSSCHRAEAACGARDC